MTRPRPTTDELVVEVHAVRSDAGLSGVVVDRGAGDVGATVGDEVFGQVPTEGAEPLVVCRGRALVRKPTALTHPEAALLAGAGTVALRAVGLAGAGPRARVMVTGASGEAGAIALQIAKARGSHVTGVSCDRDVPLVWDLGADDVYAPERWPGDSQRFAAVIDTDHSVTSEIAEQLLEPDGRLIAIHDGAIHVSTSRGAPIAVHRDSPPSETDLRELVELVERDGVFPVSDDALDKRRRG